MDNLLYIVLAFVGLLVVLQLYARINTWTKKGKKVTGIGGKLGKDIAGGKKYMIYFYTNSCAACKTMTPLIDKISKDFDNIHKVNLASEMEIGRKFGVMGTPSLVLVEMGRITEFILGARNESFLRKLLNT